MFEARYCEADGPVMIFSLGGVDEILEEVADDLLMEPPSEYVWEQLSPKNPGLQLQLAQPFSSIKQLPL